MAEGSSFVVGDRREDSVQAGVEKEVSGQSRPKEKIEGKQETTSDSAQKGTGGEQASHHIPVNFSSFILSLATSALIHLGEETDPATGQKSVQLQDGRQVIDLMTLLEEKTRGNLGKEEENLLKQLLYTLRMKFIALEKHHHP